MFGLWLHADKHNRVPRWEEGTNSWGLLEILRLWRCGYRRIRISRKPTIPKNFRKFNTGYPH